jgi:hypothetical protein
MRQNLIIELVVHTISNIDRSFHLPTILKDLIFLNSRAEVDDLLIFEFFIDFILFYLTYILMVAIIPIFFLSRSRLTTY